MGNYLLPGFESLPLRSSFRTVLALAACTVLAALALAGCLGPRSKAERVELEKNPLRSARAGDVCRYRATRDGKPGEAPVPEEWTFRVLAVENGEARIAVSVLGPPRSPPAPSPREPEYVVSLPVKDDGYSGTGLLRLFHRPDLTQRGMRAVLDRDVRSVEGSHEVRPLVVEGRTREAHFLSLSIQDPPLVRGTYRVTVVDTIPIAGIYEADLEEIWSTTSQNGELQEERRHDHLVLVDSRGS